MKKIKQLSKVIPIILIVSMLFTACDIPDISKFTEQSAEMTRGIHKGIKDTETLIRTASERKDLYSESTRNKLKENLKNYKNATKPTTDALDALDGYIGALNALSQASKKSAENSRAAVTAVSSLVTAATGLTFASEVVNVAVGVVKLAEDFRLAKSFKKRVNLASEIVEGVHPKIVNGKAVKDENGQVVYAKTCTASAGDEIADAALNIKEIVDPKLSNLSEDQRKTLNKLKKPEEKRAQLVQWKVLTSADIKIITANENIIQSFRCGIIDLIKFNIKDLKDINPNISQSMIDNITENNATIIGLYPSIGTTRRNIADELESIHVVRNLVSRINELIINQADLEFVLTRKATFKVTLDNIFSLDSPLKNSVIKSINNCGAACGQMLVALNFVYDSSCGEACENNLKAIFKDGISKSQFDKSTGLILAILEVRRDDLSNQDKKYATDQERIKPHFDAVNAEIESIKEKRNKLEDLLDSSLSALDAWAETHANLRVTVNTKQSLDVAKLTSKVREMWGILTAEAE